jgi:hypothetical protein
MFGFGKSTPVRKPSLSPETLAELRRYLDDPEQADMNPWDRAMHESLLKSYGNGEQSTGFSNRYDKYYAPFMTGMNSATNKDLIPNQYLSPSAYDSEDEAEKKHRYNLRLNKYATADPFLTAGAHGLGMVAAATGGLPGLALGMGLKHGIPLAWHLAKQHFANQNADKEMADRYYRALGKQHPTL